MKCKYWPAEGSLEFALSDTRYPGRAGKKMYFHDTEYINHSLLAVYVSS